MESLPYEIVTTGMYYCPGSRLRKRRGVCNERHKTGTLFLLGLTYPQPSDIKTVAYNEGITFAKSLSYDEIAKLISCGTKLQGSWFAAVRDVWNMLQLSIILRRQ